MNLLILAIGLFVAAVLCLWSELFVPAHGLLVILAAVFMFTSAALCFAISTAAGLAATVLIIFVLPTALYAGVRIYPYSPVGKRVILKGQVGTAVSGFEGQAAALAALTGKEGIAQTPLRPSGACEIEGQRVNCVSESTIIMPGTAIRVARVVGLQVFVQPLEQ